MNDTNSKLPPETQAKLDAIQARGFKAAPAGSAKSVQRARSAGAWFMGQARKHYGKLAEQQLPAGDRSHTEADTRRPIEPPANKV